MCRILRSLLKHHFTCSVTSCTELISRKRIRKTNFHHFLRVSSYGFIFRCVIVIGTSKGIGTLNGVQSVGPSCLWSNWTSQAGGITKRFYLCYVEPQLFSVNTAQLHKESKPMLIIFYQQMHSYLTHTILIYHILYVR